MVHFDKPLDNPINWSFKVGRLFGIDIRLHVAFLLAAVVLIWMEMPGPGEELNKSFGRILTDSLGLYAMLFTIVLLHEFGHCFGARKVGGEADEVLLWPLGGLAYVRPPHNPVAHLITTLAGPSVNVFICMICSMVLVAWTGSLGGVPWNPLHPTIPVDSEVWVRASTAQLWVMRFFGLSYFLLLINLLPIFPFDGGRVLQAWLWTRKGYRHSMELAAGTGMVGAIFVGVFGLFVEENWLLLMIAVFGYVTCWQERRMIREQAEFGAGEFGYDFAQGYNAFDEEPGDRKPGFFERRRQRRSLEREERARKDLEAREQQIELILRKISQSGMGSLSSRERAILEEETQRKRTQA